MKTIFFSAIIAVLVGLTSGCNLTVDNFKNYMQTDYQYKIIASSDINPDVEKEPSPVVLRIFQMDKLDRFITMTHPEMNLTDLEELQTQFLAVDEFFIDPATLNDSEFSLYETTQYLGVVVSFRDIENSKWRTWIKIPESGFLGGIGKKKTFEIIINKLDVILNPPYSDDKEFINAPLN